MTNELRQSLEALNTPDTHELLRSVRRGIEKEGLRVNAAGELATTPHPNALGSALTNSAITTDFSEALLELVTGINGDIDSAYDELAALHQFVYKALEDETIWAFSMPCVMPEDEAIPIAEYGSSNIGRMKHVYRVGLGHRYGRAMQTIAGVHYNYSLPDEFWHLDDVLGHLGDTPSERASIGYMALTRNFHRHCWLLMYLLGASPTVCECFLRNRDHALEQLGDGTLYLPDATSLRMSGIGYQSPAQNNISVDLNSVDGYAASLVDATNTSYPPYEKIGVKVNGAYQQLNANLLQIENEYYAVIRPKRIAQSGEKPSHALSQRGVEYVELRCLDIDPFDPVGISKETMHLLDTFCLYCLMTDSPAIDSKENARISANRTTIVSRGRADDVRLDNGTVSETREAAARNLMDGLVATAELLDAAHGHNRHRQAVEAQRPKLSDPRLTPSARILAEMESTKESYFEYGYRLSKFYASALNAIPQSRDMESRLTEDAQKSLATERSLVAQDETDFDSFLRQYFKR